MQKSKSLVSFGPTAEPIEVTQRPRTQRKSSLDTLVIPGRTRLPSSKSSSEVTDILIAQQLLNHGTMQLHDEQPWSDHIGQPFQEELPTSRLNNRRPILSPQQKPKRARRPARIQPTPRSNAQDVIVIPPHRRPQTCMPRSSSNPLISRTPGGSTHVRVYDGNNDSSGSGHISRSTSMTWSTISHRVTSESSNTSQPPRASRCLHEYNDLAERHGLHHILSESSGTNQPSCRIASIRANSFAEEESNPTQTKIIEKSHQGWLARKIFRRTTSTYTLKAKTTYKPIAKKKSLGGIQLLSENKPTNILSGKTLEEISRLGGLGILVLPSEYAVDKLTLPTCLSATAGHLLEKGMFLDQKQ